MIKISRRITTLISITTLVLLAGLTPYLPAVFASSDQPSDIDTSGLYATAPDTEWEKTLGGPDDDWGHSVQQTTESGFIIAGSTDSFGAGARDVYLIKTDASGNQMWSKTFGGSYNDWPNSVKQTTDGGFVIAGFTGAFGDVNGDVYLIKTDPSGNEQWSKTFGDSGAIDEGFSVQQTTDGGFIIVGKTYSIEEYDQDVYLIKTDASGNEQWSKTLGPADNDAGSSVQQTNDGGFIITGYTGSIGVDEKMDVYLIKTDVSGNQQWERTFGGSGDDWGESVRQTNDGGFIITGSTDSFGAGGRDVYLIKTDASGNQQWSKTLGGSWDDYGHSVQQTDDGGFVIAGQTSSFGAGSFDVYLIKSDALGNQQWNKTFGGAGSDAGDSVQQTGDGSFVVGGWTRSFGDGDSDVYLIKVGAEASTSTSTPSSTPPWLIGGIGGGIALVMIMGFIGIDKNLKKKRAFNARVKQLRSQMEKWRAEGYDVSSLEDLFK